MRATGGCTTTWETGGWPAVAIDSENHVIELLFVPPRAEVCTADCPGTTGIEAELGHLEAGNWVAAGTHAIATFSIPFWVGPFGDVNCSGRTDASDIQLVIHEALGIESSYDCDVDNSDRVDAVDVQVLINTVLEGGGSVPPPGIDF